MDLEQRITNLESQLKWTKHMLGTMMVTVAVLIGVAAVPSSRSSLELVSPKGTQKMLLKADDATSGIWIIKGQESLFTALFHHSHRLDGE